ncbi:MAG: NfeD family protein [Clostridia bacterium]|nr:NfeD family protein [Clostridia bacterium]
MEYLMANPWAIWIAVGVFFLIVELCTTALVSIWFVPAAIITCLLSFVIKSAIWQVAIFVLLSAVFMVVFRKIYKKYIKKPVDDVDQNEKLLGKIVTIIDETNAINGRVKLGDIYWKAITENGEIISQNEKAVIKSVQGTTLVVTKFN